MEGDGRRRRRAGRAQRRPRGGVHHGPGEVGQRQRRLRRDGIGRRQEPDQRQQGAERRGQRASQRPVEKTRREVEHRIGSRDRAEQRQTPCEAADAEQVRRLDQRHREQREADVGHRAARGRERLLLLQPQPHADEAGGVAEQHGDRQEVPADGREGTPGLADEVERAGDDEEAADEPADVLHQEGPDVLAPGGVARDGHLHFGGGAARGQRCDFVDDFRLEIDRVHCAGLDVVRTPRSPAGHDQVHAAFDHLVDRAGRQIDRRQARRRGDD